MSFIKAKSLLIVVFCSSLFSFSFPIPSFAASVLAAWRITTNGVLKLRTKEGVPLDAFFQSGYANTGDRVWIDFPGELIQPRKIKGNGPIKEIRLGKPYKGNTRLVVEFEPYVALNPSKLVLLGTSPNLWELNFHDLNVNGLSDIGEGVLVKSSIDRSNLSSRNTSFNYSLSSSSLPSVQRNVYRVVIDPGHGGSDPGAIGINGIRENDIVLEISKDVSRLLKEKGVEVVLTRNKNIDLELTERVLIANRIRANAFISIHANATRGYRRDVNGIETYFFAGYRGKQLAKKIQREVLNVSSGSPDRGVRQSRFFVIKQTNMPAALVEVGFLTGRIDARRLSQKNHRRKLAYAISKGILNYLKGGY
ncbi:N-acetylmuramoyl-L-alanine amidase [Prochlorococcus marinus]|uniref:N-acetylmuramoyl-L-alanine amidase n=1 Tax=Prochlorococcus marinus TaxID=1219 RepID=UPI0022B3C485|nr:N-acetylmuramoyl-L-alanine amidase [Prochlorococcus marinus]